MHQAVFGALRGISASGSGMPSQSRSARQGRVAAPSVCCAVACILLAAAPTAPPCFRRWRAGQAHAGQAKFDFIVDSSALLQRAAASEQYPCQAAANLCSRALFFMPY